MESELEGRGDGDSLAAVVVALVDGAAGADAGLLAVGMTVELMVEVGVPLEGVVRYNVS